jgi:hypothetical protein
MGTQARGAHRQDLASGDIAAAAYLTAGIAHARA